MLGIKGMFISCSVSRFSCYSTPDWLSTWMGDCLQAGKPSRYVTRGAMHNNVVD